MKADHTQVTRLLKTARGQIDGILKMIEEDRYCMDVSHQLKATQSILKKANRMVLKSAPMRPMATASTRMRWTGPRSSRW